MSVSTYVLTGFLDAGKTTLLGDILAQQGSKNMRILALQFEQGDEPLLPLNSDVVVHAFSVERTQDDPEGVASEIAQLLSKGEDQFQEIWIEWNGMLPYSLLESIVLQPALKKALRIDTILHIADATRFERLLMATGGILQSQLAQSDLVILRNPPRQRQFRALKRLIRGNNPGVRITTSAGAQLLRQVFRSPLHPVTRATLLLGGAVFLALAFSPHLQGLGIPVNNIVNAFLGMLLQALPFLLIGVSLSSAIQIFIPRESLEKHMPKSFFGGMLFMLLSGLILPVCDCASVPVFRSMVRKGVPLPLAVVFFAAAPVINPVVLLSTHYAFGGDWKMTLSRAGFGVLIALALGIIFRLRPPKDSVLSGNGSGAIACACGCEEDALPGIGFRGKLLAFLRHAQAEFFSVSQYLIIGALIASVIQSFSSSLFSAGTGGGLALSILVMMAMAFLLSLCSSSDAVVARGLSGAFPAGAIMAFLVFGPIFDIKNVLMLSAGFHKRFIVRFVLLTAALVFTAIFVLYV
ncbi:MAG TPA: permease [Clostridiales bacterium]|nr:permease [Clostridiales bacterium]